MKCETHGRWPLVGAAALAPATAFALKDARARPIAALLWHQTEEWVWPGGFLPWINETVMGSGEAEFPIDRQAGFAINVIFGWGFSAAAAAGSPAAVPATALYVSHLGNAGLHLSWAARNKQYDPGSITSVAALIPLAVTGLVGLKRDPEVSSKQLAIGAALGAVIGGAMMPLFKLRMRRSGSA
jgi:hypothetical protein